jgi:release factor glutamine methyltransferase
MSLPVFVRRLYSTAFYNGWVKPRMSRTVTTNLLDFSLTVPPSVFHPKFYFTSKFLGEFIQTISLSGKKVLDVGCGSGILSLAAAAGGATVVSVDINPAAVAATKENARRNNLHGRIDVLQSDLLAELDRDVAPFDYIIANPPFYPGEPRSMTERAFRSGNNNSYITRLASEAPAFLALRGTIVMVFSSDIDLKRTLQPFEEGGFEICLAATKHLWFERLSIVKLELPA